MGLVGLHGGASRSPKLSEHLSPLSPGNSIRARGEPAGSRKVGRLLRNCDKEGEGAVWHRHAARPRWRRTDSPCLAGWSRMGCRQARESLWRPTRAGAQRKGKPVTSPGGPVANDITTRGARSQAQEVIYGNGWRPGSAAPELFQMWLRWSLQLARGAAGLGGRRRKEEGWGRQPVDGAGGLLPLGPRAGINEHHASPSWSLP